jgi:hypothetical protein
MATLATTALGKSVEHSWALGLLVRAGYSSYSEDNVLGDNISVSQSSYIAMGIARGARPTASEKHKAGSSLDVQ